MYRGCTYGSLLSAVLGASCDVSAGENAKRDKRAGGRRQYDRAWVRLGCRRVVFGTIMKHKGKVTPRSFVNRGIVKPNGWDVKQYGTGLRIPYDFYDVEGESAVRGHSSYEARVLGIEYTTAPTIGTRRHRSPWGQNCERVNESFSARVIASPSCRSKAVGRFACIGCESCYIAVCTASMFYLPSASMT